jgi:CBS domain-containing protein
MSAFTISDFMTVSPHCIDPHEPLEAASKRMRQYRIRHLPVRSGGKVVGLLTERDLELIERLKGTEMHRTPVGEVMVADPYCVGPSTPVHEAAKEMARRKLGSVLVVDESDQILGVFTETDALRALAEVT